MKIFLLVLSITKFLLLVRYTTIQDKSINVKLLKTGFTKDMLSITKIKDLKIKRNSYGFVLYIPNKSQKRNILFI